ncbi:sulfatase-like hydrolase/transferase [Persicirhabdus sediminis]|uniref:Sulfatase-like hydrolase/transferase n=1 Tax=Persicirhabdus sediminis TaxID=454144 RepID=A0A8J7MGB1_9BACT|nr:sulfatase-like hydrolase/transferase [Persicirhabdus sediminis]MBK1792248.1 sulfatase-like hydrolase/transferase [Persicirhabdus sediminis]
MSASRNFTLFLSLVLTACVVAEPIQSSWFTHLSGQYARVYPTTVEENANSPATTWDHPTGADQLVPTYAGVSEVSLTATDLYIRTSGLAFHVMGPWYGENGGLFPNYPANIAQTARFPLDPQVAALPKSLTTGGAVGYFVDGVAMFDARDAFSYINESGRDATPADVPIRGDGMWNRDAYVNESVTFDAANAHQAGATHHYHANPTGLRYLLSDSVDYDYASNTYSENAYGTHSPILAWTFDGFPLYGPYGYADPLDPDSGIRRMISGFQKRDGTNGSSNLNTTGRSSLPQWVVDNQNDRSNPLAAEEYGPAVTNVYTLGHYIEDYAYKGDLGLTLGVDFDLNEYNVRWCVTPEFPAGTWAYFCCIEADGTPAFPYNIGRFFFGEVQGANGVNLPADREIIFEGGPEAELKMETPTVDSDSGDVTISWSGPEGGSYIVQRSADLDEWQLHHDDVKNNAGSFGSIDDEGRAQGGPQQFYRSQLTSLAPFDDNGFDYSQPVVADFTAHFDSLPAEEKIESVTIGNVAVTILSYDAVSGSLELTFDESSLAAGDYQIALTYLPDSGTPSGLTSTNVHTIHPPHNILLLIVDDWGVDSSPMDNNAQLNPSATFPPMPNLETLAARGLRFTNAYAQPICSPTRASILTGRQAARHGVGTAGGALPASELTLPEIFAAEGSPYQLASYGKWHLGGGVNGPAEIGGWPEFAGILNGGVSSYTSWNKTENGISTNNYTTYSTTDQVNEAIDFISGQSANPWFVWMAFNAPHTPFHNPPSELHDYPTLPEDENGEVTGANRRQAYEAALQALDTEIGRLLANVDLETTNVILIGDNGTPGAVVQAPYGEGHAKGSLYQGGIHVPCIIAGPDVRFSGMSHKLVHCVDLFSTILDLAKIDVSTATAAVDVIDSQSLVPVLKGQDIAQRSIVSAIFADDFANSGRTLISSEYPGYELIAYGDPSSLATASSYEMYYLPADTNEQMPLSLPPASGDHHFAAYHALVAKDAALRPAAVVGDTLYLELPNVTGGAGVPNNANLDPISITVNGVAASYIERYDQTDTYNRWWVKCTVPDTLSAPYTSAVVTFSDNPNTGDARVFSASSIIIAP